LEKHGDTAMGVDWHDKEDVVKRRYKIMLGIIPPSNETKTTLLDFGCGLGHLLEYIKESKISNVEYSGLDISKKFIDVVSKKFGDVKFYHLDIFNDNNIPEFDYIVMNGVFTEKRELSFHEMFEYFKKVLLAVFRKSKKGIAFNVMSKVVDWERDDLFHLSMDLLGEFLAKELSRKFIIRNDYGLYEYTVYLYK
jgi:SAM-dependent methyltransferase